jgi:hypothetical protein
MDAPIESFLKYVLRLEGKTEALVGDSVRIRIAEYEAMFGAAQQDERSKEFAVRGCRALCLRRIVREMAQWKGTPTEAHLQIVLKALHGSAG